MRISSIIVALLAAAQPLSYAESPSATPLRVSVPRPEYPAALRSRGIGGSGVVEVTVDRRTGRVTAARVLQSSGYTLLDDSALKAFRQWHFKPGTESLVKIPFNFSVRR